MRMTRCGLFALLIFLTGAQSGFASLSVFGTGSYLLNKVGDASISAKGSLAYGGGALLSLGLGRWTSFEFGGIYARRKVTTSRSAELAALMGVDSDTTVQSRWIHMPGMFRLGLSRSVSLGLGGFYDHPLDTGEQSNYGASGSFRVSFPMHHALYFFLDGRYNLGLKSQNSLFGTEKSREALALVGFTFGRPF